MVLSHYIGASVKRKEDPRLITGSSTYVDDLKLAGMVHVAFVRSTYAHARITGIDASAALDVPGVLAVWTAADLDNVIKPVAATTPSTEGGDQAAESDAGAAIPVPKVEPLAREKVRYIGEPVAAVIAESRPVAEDAAGLVVVHYDPLPAVVDPFEARQDGAPLLYDEVKNNIGV
ncbi:MAG: carbon monoxide dehydrogenase, partial [Chloroflexota bacterium]